MRRKYLGWEAFRFTPQICFAFKNVNLLAFFVSRHRVRMLRHWSQLHHCIVLLFHLFKYTLRVASLLATSPRTDTFTPSVMAKSSKSIYSDSSSAWLARDYSTKSFDIHMALWQALSSNCKVERIKLSQQSWVHYRSAIFIILVDVLPTFNGLPSVSKYVIFCRIASENIIAVDTLFRNFSLRVKSHISYFVTSGREEVTSKRGSIAFDEMERVIIGITSGVDVYDESFQMTFW